MKLKLKTKQKIVSILITNGIITALTCLVLLLFDISWNTIDFKVSDQLHTMVIENGKGPEVSDRIVYLNISDKSYEYFERNYLDRKFVAQVNNIFADLMPEAVMYDIVFRSPSFPFDDELFTESISNAGNIYLPAGFELTQEPVEFRWSNGAFYELMMDEYLADLTEIGDGEPYYGVKSLHQFDDFAYVAYNSGHINAVPDPDGVYRHYPMILKVDSLFFPTVTLSMFLDYNGVPFDSITIDWGNEIHIPALERSYLEEDLSIPIDNSGQVYIPYPCLWQDSPRMMEAQNLIIHYDNPDYYDELLDYFEGNFVFLGDVSSGISDLGQTSIEPDVPLVAIHAGLMNAFLTNDFYSQWSDGMIAFVILLIGIILGLFALPKSEMYLYIAGVVILVLLIFSVYYEMTNFHLMPAATMVAAFGVIFFGLVISLQVINAMHEAFIKNAFSKYVPQKVVDELIEKPNMLALGGEVRELSILFSDIKSFTTISENMQPPELVALLNDYLTNMTDIIFEHQGIVDKFIGDAILAEFGAPIPMDGHADVAVTTALHMQNRIEDLNAGWQEKGYPEIRARVGINTGTVVLGNMGSQQVFDYTVIGDNVNLASRLEGANKRYNTSLMISENTYEQLTHEKFFTRPLDLIKVKGRSQAVKVYEVIDFAENNLPEEKVAYYNSYKEAFYKYLDKDFKEAANLFSKALELSPNDPASREFLERIKVVSEQELDENWDGSIVLTEK